jgi:hypothetical protein
MRFSPWLLRDRAGVVFGQTKKPKQFRFYPGINPATLAAWTRVKLPLKPGAARPEPSCARAAKN